MAVVNMENPKLRFSSNGQLKFVDWGETTLGAETLWASGGTPSKQNQDYWNGDIPWVSASSMRGIRFSDSENKITVNGLKNGSKLAPPNSLLLLVRGSMLFNKIPVGLAACELAFNQDVKCIIPKEAVVPEFLLHWFLASENKLLNMVTGTGIGAGKLDTNELQVMGLMLPSLAEQQKIASFLSAVDQKISLLTKNHELLLQYKKGVMQKIFNQEIKFRDDGGKDFPGWKSMSLAELGDTYNGLTGKTADDFGVGANYVTYKQIFDSSRIDASKFGCVSIKPGERQNMARYGDLFFTTSSETPNEVGYCSVLLEDVKNLYLNSFCFGYRIKSFEVLSPKFARLMFFSSNVRESIVLLAQGSTRYNISKTNFMKIKVLVPGLKEQEKISLFLESLEGKLATVASQLELTKQYKQGLLQQMFI
jgi:type I restriction enzyme S subunit